MPSNDKAYLPPRRTPVKAGRKSIVARRIESAINKLSNAQLRRDYSYSSLSELERIAARGLVEAAVKKVNSSKRPIKEKNSFVIYEGVKFPLMFSNFGRVFVCCPKTGRTIFSSGVMVI